MHTMCRERRRFGPGVTLEATWNSGLPGCWLNGFEPFSGKDSWHARMGLERRQDSGFHQIYVLFTEPSFIYWFLVQRSSAISTLAPSPARVSDGLAPARRASRARPHRVLRIRQEDNPSRGLPPLRPLLLLRARPPAFPSATPGVPQITFEELNRRIYHTCILHDLGWTTTAEGRAHPAHAMTFELHGGIMAYEHLHAAAPALNAQQVGDIVQSIVLHTSDWPFGKVSATKLLISLSAIFDVAGYDAYGPGSFDSFISRKTVQEIEKVYPRGNFAAEGEEVLQREVAEKPDCLLTHFPGGLDAFLKIVRKDPIVPVGE
ncbi:hypothetical protein B0H11DRAFT_2283868 [Mycena galericulata]|nr:hypothetical protein B0H11DRAFT_2283868 [Mycena galericulata]